jgi:hypothetical protein
LAEPEFFSEQIKSHFPKSYITIKIKYVQLTDNLIKLTKFKGHSLELNGIFEESTDFCLTSS